MMIEITIRHRATSRRLALLALGLASLTFPTFLVGCEKSDAGKPRLTREELLNPESCKGCHPSQYREWSSSMHAYASKDPVFLAMNARGQEEAQLGDFCIKCHAPMAVREGATHDGLNLAEVPEKLQGVTCYFCHNAVSVGKDHFNNPIELANDDVMRAALGSSSSSPEPAVEPYAHGVEYSKHHDRNSHDSSKLCGSCHDIVTPAHVHLERTFEEYETSVFSKPGAGFLSCQSCHMNSSKGTAADYEGVPLRSVHEHLFPGVDVALTDFPNRDAMRSAVEKCSLGSFSIQYFQVQIPEPGMIRVQLETSAGHAMPSGSSQDRRLWLEVNAYDADGKKLLSSGNIDAGELEELPEGDPKRDSQLCMFRDRIVGEDGKEKHMFWEAARVDSRLMPTAITPQAGSHTATCSYHYSGTFGPPARMTVRVRMRPMGMDVLNDLVASKHLDAALLAEVPTYTVHDAEIVWDSSSVDDLRIIDHTERDCESYKCMLDPDSPSCGE